MKQILIIIGVQLACALPAGAQPFTLDEHINPVELKLEDHTKEGESKPAGRISVNKLTQETDTAYYYLGGFSIYGPSYVSLTSAHDSESLQIDLFKENWKESMQSGNVNGKSTWKTNFKTEGDFGIRIITKIKPSHHVLLIYTGNDMKLNLPSPFSGKPATTAGTGSWFKKNMLLLGGGAVALLALLFFAFKKSKRKAITILLLMLLSQMAYPQRPEAGGVVDVINQVLARDVSLEQHEGVLEAMNQMNETMGNLSSNMDSWRSLRTLGRGECTPEFTTSGAAMMASTCDGNTQCSSCFEKAVGDLNFMRLQLGRLSCIYNNTKSYTQSALSFGDNVSGIHGMTGLAWQSQRPGIVQAMESMKNACKEKYAGMMTSLEKALKDIDACEARYGLPDWYQRFGFIYYEFMKEKYKIVD
jgi:hypothetical protein